MDVLKGVLADNIRGLKPGNAPRVIEAEPIHVPDDDPILEMGERQRRRHVETY